MSIKINKASLSDLDALLILEKECFISPWQETNLKYEISENPVGKFYVLKDEEKIIGFCDYWITFDNATICQICVSKKYRQKGYASLMLQRIIDECKSNRLDNINLEVRENNVNARNLYKKFGFAEILLKKQYYSNGDNAVYMIKELVCL